MEYLIRNCVKEDLSEVVKLCKKHAEYEREALAPEGGQMQLGLRLESAIFSVTPRLFCFVVEVENNIIGYATYAFDFSTWDAQQFLYLDCLYLEDDFRGMGIGEAVMKTLERIAKENHCVNIQWQTPIWNERAIKFYQRMGGVGREKMRFGMKTGN
jgi:GNAT superfamily N-acetyltransferase